MAVSWTFRPALKNMRKPQHMGRYARHEKWLRLNTSQPSYHERMQRLCTHCFLKVGLCLSFRSLPSSCIHWMIGFSLSIALKGTHRQPSWPTINAETERPSTSKEARKAALSCLRIMYFFSLHYSKLSLHSFHIQ